MLAPGRQDTGQTRERRPDATLGCGESFACRSRSGAQGVVREAVQGTEKRAQGRRDRAGQEDVGPGELLLQVVVSPLLGFRLLTRRAGPVAA